MTTTSPRIDNDPRTIAASLGPALAANAARHDADGTFVEEAFALLRDRGLLALAVPTELGGLGATLREISAVQQEIGRHCASTALASAMHQHVTAFTAWRYRRGLPGAEATLRRVADEGIVLVSTGGADLTQPKGEAVRDESGSGWRVSGRKAFASQSPAGTVLSTMFPYDHPDGERRVLNMAVPLSSPGVTVLDDWDALGMRGTGSNTVVLEDVHVPDERVLADRPHGVVDPPLQMILTIAIPIISAVYLGAATAAYESAVLAVVGSTDPIVQRQVGAMSHRLRIAQWALDRAGEEIGDDPAPSVDLVLAAMAAKREIVLTAIEVCDTAMEVAGGRAFVKGSPIERAYRDVRAAKFHPFTPELTLVHAGRHALGIPVDSITAEVARP
jgi:alkylation response protein AidB-like acyl-CoA dehydrogenase